MNWDQIIPRIVKLFDGVVASKQWHRLNAHLEALNASKEQVFFVEIGSNDGKMFDPVFEYVMSGRWHGIMVEPVAHYFEQLQSNYAGASNIVFENVAISQQQEVRDFYRIEDGHDFLPAWTHGLGSFYEEVLLSHEKVIPGLRKYIVKQQVECVSLQTLMSRHQVNSLDLLVIDTEGYDFEVIKQLDFSSLKPQIIVYEHKHLSQADRVLCKELLAVQGYSFESEMGNTLASLRG